MAKHKRKPAKGKPITSHQLFPAVVALWFGALFGLGSLAVRPSLIEGLVLKSHLDLVIPAAAPPLGVTARILVALILAALGVVIGIAIARRITRPKPVVTERKRSGRDLGRDEGSSRSRYADASTRPPVLTRGEFAEETEAAGGGGVLAARRRSLAIEHEEEEFVPHEIAPLPGGSPQVFDISELDIDASVPAAKAAPVAEFEIQPAAAQGAPVNLDWTNVAPLAGPAAPIAVPPAIEAQRQVFQSEPAPVEGAVPCPASEAAHAAGRQVFGMSPPPPPSEASRQIFGAAVTDDHVDPDFVKAAGFKTTVFEQEPAQPLFAERAAAPTEQAAAPVPQAFEPAEVPPAAAPEPVSGEALPSPASLGMTDLAARLAESMRRRRAARGEAIAEPIAAPAACETAVEASAQIPAAAIPQAYEPAPVAAPAPIPQAFEAPAEQPAAPVEPVAEPPAPAFAAPAPTFAAPAPGVAAPEPVAAPLPRAMQPLALDAFIEEDALPDPSLLPPRHIAMPVAPVLPIAAPAEPAEPAPLELAIEDEVVEEGQSPEADYGSLLGITPARNPFVRIDEPEAANAEVEPVVIFPGQTAAQPAPFASPGDTAPFRRFDAPAAAGHGQPVAANAAAPAIDSAEAERALRAALSNLQRMSGAA